MTKSEVLEMYDKQCFVIGEHKPLVVLVCIVYEESIPYEEEFIFTVPIDWLISYKDKMSGRRQWDWEKVQWWLQNEYTAEDSEPIFEQAILENVCVNVNF